MSVLTVERLKELLHYDPETGVFTWQRTDTPFNLRFRGKSAGTLKARGYIEIGIDGRKYKAHHLAWLWAHGELPKVSLRMGIDHINRDSNDNRICNLRLVRASMNCQNRRQSIPNTSGIKGVSWFKYPNPKYSRWVAYMNAYGKRIFLGYSRDIVGAAGLVAVGTELFREEV